MILHQNGLSEFLVGPVALRQAVLCQPLPHSGDLVGLVQR
jgi:hypothetical protein